MNPWQRGRVFLNIKESKFAGPPAAPRPIPLTVVPAAPVPSFVPVVVAPSQSPVSVVPGRFKQPAL